MQGDWWSSANFASSKELQQSSDQTAGDSAVATPSVVTLTVHPISITDSNPIGPAKRSGTGSVAVSGTSPRLWPCNQTQSTYPSYGHGVASSTSHLILAAQRRKRLHFNQQKTHSRKLGFGSQPDIIEPDLTWTSFFEHRRTQAAGGITPELQQQNRTASLVAVIIYNMVETMGSRYHSNHQRRSGHSGSNTATRGTFKGYVVTVGENNITITRNYSSIGARDLRTKNQISNPKLERSATVLPIVASPKSAEFNCNNSSNSTSYSNQDGVQGSSPVVSSSGQSSDIGRQMSSEDLKHFERKLEREREKRIHTEPPPSRLDARVGSESGPQFDLNNLRRNGFRPTSKNSFMRDQPNVHLTAFRHGHAPPPVVDTIASLSITSAGAPTMLSNSGASGALRGQSIGFGNRETSGGGLNGSTMGIQGRTSNVKTRTRAAFLSGQSEKYKQNQYPFHDPAAGATPDFTQRLAELTSLESDTIRYERTKKAKKKSKQDSG